MRINQNLKNCTCLNCQKILGTFSPSSNRLRCPNCGYEFLIFDNKIPILLKDYRPNLAASYLQHKAVICENEKLIQQVLDARARQPERDLLLDRVISACRGDNRYFQSLQAAMLRHISESDIEEMEKSGSLPRQYTLDEGIAFFHRDWCWDRRSEEEIATIVDTVFHQVTAFAEDTETVLVPGAGAGRFACELAPRYDTCFALDNALHMAQVFYDLLERDLTLPPHQMLRLLAFRRPPANVSLGILNSVIPGRDAPIMENRQAVRALFLAPDGCVLLMKIEEPASRLQFWITPGGAVEPGESAEEGLRREVEEETGLRDIQIGPLIWTRAHQFTWDGRAYSQQGAFYLVKTARFEPHMDEKAAPGEWQAFRGFRWWSVEQIRRSEDTFVPRRLADLIEQLIKNGPPEEPFDVGI